MIKHLQTKISKVTNKDKVELKKEVFTMWKQPQVPSVDQMYRSDWFSEKTRKTWEETQDKEKMWCKCQTFFENAYIARKRHINTKDQPKDSINKIIDADLNMYFAEMEAKSAQENKEHNKHIQQVMDQIATLQTLVQEQQKKIKELMK